jgi:hypothetical protein
MERSFILSFFLWLCLPVTKVVNRINWRFGRPFSCKFIEVEKVTEYLNPGAVILTHKKYEFSTLFIPGYWTHSALVVTAGLIVEATGKGVCMNTPESFFSSIDDFIVLQPRFCCQDTMKRAVEHASSLVGYPFSYDFRNSDEMFYCSGLICRVYAQTLIEKENLLNIPSVFQNFLNGNIIKPMDLFTQQESWKIIGSFKLESAFINC